LNSEALPNPWENLVEQPVDVAVQGQERIHVILAIDARNVIVAPVP
jgi:hypothetical protein